MSAAISVRIDGPASIERALRGIAARVADLRPLMEAIGQTLESSAVQRFETETAPDGSRWKPSQRARESGGKTLTDSARLKQSLTYVASADQVEIGSNVIYAGVHNDGAVIRAKNGGRLRFRLPGGLGFRSVEQVILPKRTFLGVSADDEAEILALGEDYLAGEAGAGGDA